uniref:Uncharacterized protein n=1 Tax=Anguilla anguilla TaxID=7936 RepID=A0A0E9TAP5_ANGAN
MINKNQEDLRICSPQTNAYLSFNNSYAYVKRLQKNHLNIQSIASRGYGEK